MNHNFVDRSLNILEVPKIRELARSYSKNLANRHVDIGFNVFAIVSDVYHRENFHSDVIKAFLDPTAPHGDGDRFLRVFLEYLNKIDPRVVSENYTDARIEREEGRIDILIADETSHHAIIIENKINGARDMERQIPRYLEYAKDYICDAIIYLRLYGNAGPDQTGWSQKEKESVFNLLSIVRAYDETPSDLYSGWITKCASLSKSGSEADFLLRQYGQLIKSLGKHVMNKPLMDEFFAQMLDQEKYRAALSLKSMLDDLVLYRVERVIQVFKSDLVPFSRIDNYKNADAYFTGLLIGDAHFGVDIQVEAEVSKFLFWDRKDSKGKNGEAKKILTKMGVLDQYRFEDGWFLKDFKFPAEEDALYAHIREFKRILASVVQTSRPS